MNDGDGVWPRSTVAGISADIVGGGTPAREVPTHWGGGIPWVTPGELTNLSGKYLDTTAETISPMGLAGSGARLLPRNALLVTTRATLGSVALTAAPVATNQGFRSIVFKAEANPDFYYHLFGTLKREMERRASGTTFLEISGKEFGAIEVPLPPLKNQQRVAEILDSVDSAIQVSASIISKAQAMKQGLVDDLVARAESGVARGLAGATRRSIGDLVRSHGGLIQTGPFGSQLHAHDYVHEGVPVVMPQDIVVGQISLAQAARITEPTANALSRHRMKVGDVVFSRRGDLTRCAAIGAREAGWLCGTGCLLVRPPAQAVRPGWLALVYRHEVGQAHVRAQAVGSTMPNLNISILEGLAFPIPSIEEQDSAVALEASQRARIDLELANHEKLVSIKRALQVVLFGGKLSVSGKAEA